MCEFCDVKMINISTKAGWLDMVWNHKLAEPGEVLYVNRDENGVYIYGSGECSCDIYYPKYCPECGRKLR